MKICNNVTFDSSLKKHPKHEILHASSLFYVWICDIHFSPYIYKDLYKTYVVANPLKVYLEKKTQTSFFIYLWSLMYTVHLDLQQKHTFHIYLCLYGGLDVLFYNFPFFSEIFFTPSNPFFTSLYTHVR